MVWASPPETAPSDLAIRGIEERSIGQKAGAEGKDHLAAGNGLATSFQPAVAAVHAMGNNSTRTPASRINP